MAPAWTLPCLRRGREFLQIDGECCGSAGCFKSPSTGQDVGLQSNHPCDGAEYSVLLVGTVCWGHRSLSSYRNCKRRRFWQHSPQRSFGHIGLECPRVRSLGLNLRIRMSCSATPLVAGELWSGSELFTCFACRAMRVGVFEQKHIQSPVHLTEAPLSQVRSFGSSSRPPLRRSSYAPRPVRVLGLEFWKRGLKRPDVARRQARINAEERDAICLSDSMPKYTQGTASTFSDRGLVLVAGRYGLQRGVRLMLATTAAVGGMWSKNRWTQACMHTLRLQH